MKLTQREKALLSVLAVLLIAFGIVFVGILPQWDKKESAKNQIAQNEMMVLRMQQSLARYGKQAEELNVVKAEAMEGLSYIMMDLTNDTLDDLIRSLAEESDIVLSSMTIVGPDVLALDQYGNLPVEAEETTSYPIKQYLIALFQRNEEAEQNTATRFSPVYLMKNSVAITFDGSYTQMQQMIDRVRALNTTLYVEESSAVYVPKTKKWKVQLVLGAYYVEDQR